MLGGGGLLSDWGPLLFLCVLVIAHLLPPPFPSVPSLVSHPSFPITAPPPSMYQYPPSAQLKGGFMAGAHTHDRRSSCILPVSKSIGWIYLSSHLSINVC